MIDTNCVRTFGKVWIHLFSKLAFIKLADIPTLETLGPSVVCVNVRVKDT